MKKNDAALELSFMKELKEKRAEVQELVNMIDDDYFHQAIKELFELQDRVIKSACVRSASDV